MDGGEGIILFPCMESVATHLREQKPATKRGFILTLYKKIWRHTLNWCWCVRTFLCMGFMGINTTTALCTGKQFTHSFNGLGRLDQQQSNFFWYWSIYVVPFGEVLAGARQHLMCDDELYRQWYECPNPSSRIQIVTTAAYGIDAGKASTRAATR